MDAMQIRNRDWLAVARVVMAALVGLAGVIAAGPSAGADELPRETIFYTALRPAGWDLYVLQGPPTPWPVAVHPDLDYNAAFSPDGRWLVFCSERGGNPDLYLLVRSMPDAGPRRLLESPAMEDAAAFAADGKTLLLVSDREGNADIYSIPFDPQQGTLAGSPTNLTRHAGGDFNPAFSPDGQQIAFSSDRDGVGGTKIFIMQADGSQVRCLVDAAGYNGSPAWSRDGKHVYYYADRDGPSRIWRVAVEGGQPQPISPEDLPAVSPAVLPEGRIAFSGQRDGRWSIFTVGADGDGLRRECDGQRDYFAPAVDPRSGAIVCHGVSELAGPTFQSGTPGPMVANDRQSAMLPDRQVQLIGIRGYFPTSHAPAKAVVCDEGFSRLVRWGVGKTTWEVLFEPPDGRRAWRPSWSKDGRWVVCSVGQTFADPGTPVHLWKMKADGSQATNLTPDAAANHAFPDFSPDGKRIVFRGGMHGQHDLYLMDSDGGNLRRLTEHPAVDTMPAFSPDGKTVAFTSNRDDGDYEIYLLPLDGDGSPGEPRRLTRSPGRDTHPKFSPDGKWLVFASQRGGLNDETPLIPVFNPQPYGEIFVMRLADGHTLRLTHNKWEDGTPDWSAIMPLEE